ncbi:Smr/MutS family protein [Halomonas halocynthiae]|uniref:Smr/MutS family protein n=1 Tax=Halomonas halocynthiae TaxID=176290 RepID=UPI00040B2ED2|nr:Smr/MutS family protein [Halomonas halocynthiae]
MSQHSSHHHPDHLDPEDVSAFRNALSEAGVRRIESNQADPGRPKTRDQSSQRRREAAASHDPTHQMGRSSDGRVTPVRPSEVLEFAVPDLPYRTRSQLKRGQITWEAGLDLHNYTLDQARAELESFLNDARAAKARCVIVVHGKAWGSTADYPVIKSHVNAWLREWPSVLAFCSAIEADGGAGAVYVLLKRKHAADANR